MCKYYQTKFGCCLAQAKLCIIKPCRASYTRPDNQRCDLICPAKEPVVVAQYCDYCEDFWNNNEGVDPGLHRANIQAVLGKHYELSDLTSLKRVVLSNRWQAKEEAVVIEPDVFESLCALKEMLPQLDSDSSVSEQEVGWPAEQQDGQWMPEQPVEQPQQEQEEGKEEEEEVEPKPTFTMDFAYRTRVQ